MTQTESMTLHQLREHELVTLARELLETSEQIFDLLKCGNDTAASKHDPQCLLCSTEVLFAQRWQDKIRTLQAHIHKKTIPHQKKISGLQHTP